MKVGLDKDEMYPTYFVCEDGDPRELVADVDEETVSRWRTTTAAFYEVQGEMEAAYTKADRMAADEYAGGGA